jgi:hypothetical protein
MVRLEPLPSPTTEESEAAKDHWIGLNPYWWSILQGKMAELLHPYVWQDYTDEIEYSILSMMQNQVDELIIPYGQLIASGVAVYKSATQSLPNNAVTVITFDVQEAHVETGMHNIAVENSRLYAVMEGWHQISARIHYTAHSTGYRAVIFYLNGSQIESSPIPATPSPVTTAVFASRRIYLTAGDYLQVVGQQNSGGALNIVGGAAGTRAELFYIGK